MRRDQVVHGRAVHWRPPLDHMHQCSPTPHLVQSHAHVHCCPTAAKPRWILELDKLVPPSLPPLPYATSRSEQQRCKPRVVLELYAGCARFTGHVWGKDYMQPCHLRLLTDVGATYMTSVFRGSSSSGCVRDASGTYTSARRAQLGASQRVRLRAHLTCLLGCLLPSLLCSCCVCANGSTCCGP